jgi:CheY-like chemotaxis protein
MMCKRILIVEDESIVALHLKVYLGKQGHIVPAIATSGSEAIRLAKSLKPDLVLMDIRLDGAIDGIEAARVIRTQLGIPVVFVTAHSDDSTRQRAEGVPPSGYLTKPFTEKRLVQVVDVALSGGVG